MGVKIVLKWLAGTKLLLGLEQQGEFNDWMKNQAMPSLLVSWCQGDFSGQGSFIQILFTCNSCDLNPEWGLAAIVICQACYSTAQREWVTKPVANPLDRSADSWLTCVLTGNLFYTLLQCAPQLQSSAVDPLSFAFQIKGKKITFYLACYCCHCPQTTQNLVSSLHAGWSSSSRAVTCA